MKLYGCDKGSYDDGWQVCYYCKVFLLIYVLLLGGLPAGIEIPLYWELC